jgi:hypothetical protein
MKKFPQCIAYIFSLPSNYKIVGGLADGSFAFLGTSAVVFLQLLLQMVMQIRLCSYLLLTPPL